MQGKAMGFVVGMFVAAVVGVIASFVVQAYGPQLTGTQAAESPDTGEVVGAVVEGKLGGLEANLNERIERLNLSIETLSAQVAQLQQKVGTLGESVGALAKGAGPHVAWGEDRQPVDEGLKNALNEALEERDRQRAEERAEQRAQRMEGMQEMMQGLVDNRVKQLATDNNWDTTKSEHVKQILNDGMEKVGELFRSTMRGGGPPSAETFQKMRELMGETRSKLLEVMTEEEVDYLLQGMGGPPGMFGPRRGGGSGGQPPQGR